MSVKTVVALIDALAIARAERDRARDLAVALEQENARLEDALEGPCDCCLDDEAAEMLPNIETVAVREGLL
jgi:hypothetical protein